MAAVDGIKLFVQHRKGCAFGDGTGSHRHAFAVYDRADLNRAQNGRKGGSTFWHVFRCNDPRCPAEAGVRWDVLAELVASGLDVL
jgi:hypothetical protein